MFVVSTQSKKAKFIIHTEPKPKPTLTLQKPLPSLVVPTPKPLFVPKIKKFKFKLSFVKDNHSSMLKSKKSKDNFQCFQKGKFRKTNSNIKYACGRWKEDEHKRFIEAIIKYGNDWKQVQKHVRTRSSTQARSHAQKFFVKIKKAKLLNFNLDLSKTSIKMFHDMIQEVTPEEYEKIISALTSVAFERNSSKKRKKNEHSNSATNNNTNSNTISLKDDNSANKPCFIQMPNQTDETTTTPLIQNDIDLLNPNKEKEIQYIFNALINHITNEELYGYDNYLQINSNEPTNQEFTRRKRSSVNSISGFFKAYIDDNEIKNLKINTDNSNNNNFYSSNNNRLNTVGSMSNFFGYDEGKIFSGMSSRKISQEDDNLFGYVKDNVGNK